MIKRRKVDRACDACRRRKTKCDGPKMADNICSSCSQSGRPCTYVELSKPRGPPKSYIISLEDKKEAMEALLQKLFPGADFSEELGPPVIRDSWKNEDSARHSSTPSSNSRATSSIKSSSSSQLATKLENLEAPLSLLPTPRLTPATGSDKKPRHRQWDMKGLESSSSSDDFSSDDSEEGESAAHALSLRGTEEGIFIAGDPESARFHGRSSVPGIADATRRMKEMLLEDSRNPHSQPINTRRPYFWQTPKWELDWEGYNQAAPNFHDYVISCFPPPDLATSLINDYFQYLNPFYSILHRHTFERLYREGMHHRDIWFAAVCLSVFAIASKWSKDLRVIPETDRTSTNIDWGKAGWEYFNLVLDIHRVRRSLILPATLYEIQTFPLLALFLRTTSAYIVGWIFVSVGLRKSQDVGAHRKKMYKDKLEGELWKRAFWNLVLLDALGATILGRPSCISQEEYDVEMPAEVDDEYWESEDPAQAFKQPPGVPCKVSSFVQILKIIPILSFAQRTMYAMDKSGSFVPRTHQEREKVLEQLETALDDWYKSVPVHLAIFGSRADPRFVGHSAMIHFVYYFANIITYRPFTLSRYNDVDEASRPVADKAMTVSLAAARSIINLTEKQLSSSTSSMTSVLYSSYYAGGQLVLGIWYLKAKEKARKEKKDLARDRPIPLPSRLGLQLVNCNDTDMCLANYIEELVRDLRRLVGMYENLQGKWDFTQPIVAWLRESLPKDGTAEVPEPGNLYPPDIQPLLTGYEQSQEHDGSTSIPTEFFSFGHFVDKSQLREPQLPSTFTYPDVHEGSLFSGHIGLVSSQAQPSDHLEHSSEAHPHSHLSNQAVPAQTSYHHDSMQLREAWPTRRASTSALPDHRRSQLYSTTGAQPSLSALGSSDLHHPSHLVVGSQSSQSGSANYQEWYESTPLYREQQYGASTAGGSRYHTESRPFTEYAGAEVAGSLAQMQQGHSNWINQPAPSHNYSQRFTSTHESTSFPNADFYGNNIQYLPPWRPHHPNETDP